MKNIAIIGSGISGLTCAYLLSRIHNITLFESNDYIGGHTATKTVSIGNKDYDVDTGFIVFNDWTYPNFIKLLGQLGVESQKTEMSFSVKSTEPEIEYSGNGFNTLFAQRSNLFKPKYWHFLKEILRFNQYAVQDLELGRLSEDATLGEYLQQKNYSQEFIHYYLIPMGSAIWSASESSTMDFPLQFFVRFFKNHGLLSVNKRPQWHVIKGGSHQYVKKILNKFDGSINLSTPVSSVERKNNHVHITSSKGVERFDEVIFACHSDQALALLDKPSLMEQDILGKLAYQNNEVVLHTDESLLPKRKLAWASWNYNLDNDQNNPPALTYNMNILQGLDCPETVCVTLNNTDLIDPTKILGRYDYAHPSFTLEGMQAQAQWQHINGIQNTWFCGAYWFNGFHEDGVNSALRVCKNFGEEL